MEILYFLYCVWVIEGFVGTILLFVLCAVDEDVSKAVYGWSLSQKVFIALCGGPIGILLWLLAIVLLFLFYSSNIFKAFWDFLGKH